MQASTIRFTTKKTTTISMSNHGSHRSHGSGSNKKTKDPSDTNTSQPHGSSKKGKEPASEGQDGLLSIIGNGPLIENTRGPTSASVSSGTGLLSMTTKGEKKYWFSEIQLILYSGTVKHFTFRDCALVLGNRYRNTRTVLAAELEADFHDAAKPVGENEAPSPWAGYIEYLQEDNGKQKSAWKAAKPIIDKMLINAKYHAEDALDYFGIGIRVTIIIGIAIKKLSASAVAKFLTNVVREATRVVRGSYRHRWSGARAAYMSAQLEKSETTYNGEDMSQKGYKPGDVKLIYHWMNGLNGLIYERCTNPLWPETWDGQITLSRFEECMWEGAPTDDMEMYAQYVSDFMIAPVEHEKYNRSPATSLTWSDFNSEPDKDQQQRSSSSTRSEPTGPPKARHVHVSISPHRELNLTAEEQRTRPKPQVTTLVDETPPVVLFHVDDKTDKSDKHGKKKH